LFAPKDGAYGGKWVAWFVGGLLSGFGIGVFPMIINVM